MPSWSDSLRSTIDKLQGVGGLPGRTSRKRGQSGKSPSKPLESGYDRSNHKPFSFFSPPKQHSRNFLVLKYLPRRLYSVTRQQTFFQLQRRTRLLIEFLFSTDSVFEAFSGGSQHRGISGGNVKNIGFTWCWRRIHDCKLLSEVFQILLVVND